VQVSGTLIHPVTQALADLIQATQNPPSGVEWAGVAL